MQQANVILTMPNDPRLPCQYDAPCWHQQEEDGPIFLTVRRDATDAQLNRCADRFGLTLSDLQNFRARVANG